MAPLIALYDACVLYPAPLRDFLMQLAMTDVHYARWTDAIHEEWISNVLACRPDLTRAKLERTRDLMNANVRDCVVSGYESLIPRIHLPDPNDRHVLAAAIHCGASVIVTFNTKDFPHSILDALGIAATHPDDFVESLFHIEPSSVCLAAKRHRASLKKPPKTVNEYLECLTTQRMPKTAARLTHVADYI
ncbi:MAG TPA: PIN domain-containing protein [Planctomycetota bacterium]|nr:PIN domain-containing protein [Planctomycetota bacterium]